MVVRIGAFARLACRTITEDGREITQTFHCRIVAGGHWRILCAGYGALCQPCLHQAKPVLVPGGFRQKPGADHAGVFWRLRRRHRAVAAGCDPHDAGGGRRLWPGAGYCGGVCGNIFCLPFILLYQSGYS